MPAIRCASYSGSVPRANLGFLPYSVATWTHWCRRHNAEFLLLQDPFGGQLFQDQPPTIQRWLALEPLLQQFGQDAAFAFVDADTMIRWDAPDLFALAGDRFTAVKDTHGPWVHNSIKQFQPFFPDVQLNWWEYFNAGMILLNARHLPLIHALTAFALDRKAELAPIFNSWQFGDDQTPLNFLAKRLAININFLDARFNMMHCVPATQQLFQLEHQANLPHDTPLDLSLSALPFIEMGYIWHFNNVVHVKTLVMAKVWPLISAAYSTPS